MSLGSENGGLPAVMNVEPAGTSNGNNGGWGGDWGAWIVLFLIFGLFGYGGFGGGFGGFGGMGGGAYPAESILQRSLDTQTIIGKLDGVNQGICNLGYDQLSQMNNISSQLASGFAGIGNAICNSEYQNAQLVNGINTNMMQGFNAQNVAYLQGQNALQSQLAQCCCDNRVGQMQIQNQMASDTCAVQNTIQSTTRDVIDNQNSNARAILDALNQNYIRTLESENQSLKLSASQDRQNALLTTAMANQTNQIIGALQPPAPIPAYQVPNPLTGCCGVPTCGGCGC